MPTRMRRTQVLLPEDQYLRLRREAEARHCSIGRLVREAVDAMQHGDTRQARIGAAKRIAAMDLPVADWEQMEQEIERGLLGE